MKLLFVLCFVLPLCLGDSSYDLYEAAITNPELLRNLLERTLKYEINGRAVIAATLNHYADLIFENVGKLILNDHLDPTALPDVTESDGLLELDLRAGVLQGLSTLYRGGDVRVSYENERLTIDIPVTFDDMKVEFDYTATFLTLGPSGVVDGEIKNVRMDLQLTIDFEHFIINLSNYEVIDTGHIELIFHGNDVIDWLLDLISNLVTAIIKSSLLDTLQDVIQGGLQSFIDTVNQTIDDFLNSPGNEENAVEVKPVSRLVKPVGRLVKPIRRLVPIKPLPVKINP